MPDPRLPFRQRVTLRLLSPALWFGLAAFLMGVAFLIIALGLPERFDQKRAEDTCRSRIAGQVSQAQGEVSLAVGDVSEAVGDGLAALRNDDEAAAVQAQVYFDAAKTRLASARRRLQDALEARERSEETCDQR